MAKRIKNPVILSVVYHLDGSPHIQASTVSYGLECDDGLEDHTSLDPTFTPTQQNDLMDILNEALLTQINAKEGI